MKMQINPILVELTEEEVNALVECIDDYVLKIEMEARVTVAKCELVRRIKAKEEQ